MIVVCTRCQAKFRVADEKVGPRGAKVRCSKCQDVFLVHRDLGSVPLGTPVPAAPAAPPAPPRPAVELDLEPGGAEPPRAPPVPATPDPFAGVDPFAAAAAPPRAAPPPLDDPFLAATRSSLPPPAASADPFAAVLGAPAAAADPFGEPAFTRQDPFAAGAAPPPADAAPEPIAPPGALPLTDLGDLMGPQPGPGDGAPLPDAGQDGETSDPDFALEDRAPRSPRPGALEAAAEAAESAAATAAATHQEQNFWGGTSEEPLALATESTGEVARPPPPPSPAPADRPSPSPAAAPGRRRVRAPAADEAQAELAAKTLAKQLPRLRRASRLRKVALNALALVVLVIVATALLILWRSGGRLEPGALRPSAILRALGGRPAGVFAAVDVTSGAYDRAKGPPLLFVRGRAVSRAGAPVRGLWVSVEVVRRGEVVARGRALAGAVPTPEELSGIADAAALEVLARAAQARAPASIGPGEEVPFLVAIADYPQDVGGAALRLQVAEAQRGEVP